MKQLKHLKRYMKEKMTKKGLDWTQYGLVEEQKDYFTVMKKTMEEDSKKTFNR